MSSNTGWRPVREPSGAVSDGLRLSPFAKLARAHAFSVAGDAMVAVALAGSLFFSIDPSAARWRVGLYLVLTMAPFAIVAPLLGPAMDRAKGGRRMMIVLSCGLRATVCLLLIDHIDGLLLFPEAFALLVLGKGYHVAKSAVVPTTVRNDDELVEANSKLSLLSGVTGLAAGAPAAAIGFLLGSEWVAAMAAVVFALGAVAAWRIPRVEVAPEPADAAERAELRGAGIVLAASAMGLMRGIVGFLTFLLAFALRGGGERAPPLGAPIGRAVRGPFDVAVESVHTAPEWHFGVVLAASVVGGLVGAALAPRARKSVTEEQILTAAIASVAGTAVLTLVVGPLASAALMAFAVGLGTGAGKQAFDALVQRDAPDANRGRSFARFETRFQLVWVIGGLAPVILPIPASVGFVFVGIAAVFAAVSYRLGLRATHR